MSFGFLSQVKIHLQTQGGQNFANKKKNHSVTKAHPIFTVHCLLSHNIQLLHDVSVSKRSQWHPSDLSIFSSLVLLGDSVSSIENYYLNPFFFSENKQLVLFNSIILCVSIHCHSGIEYNSALSLCWHILPWNSIYKEIGRKNSWYFTFNRKWVLKQWVWYQSLQK